MEINYDLWAEGYTGSSSLFEYLWLGTVVVDDSFDEVRMLTADCYVGRP